MRLEQTAAVTWVKGQGWDCIADYLEEDNLLQVPVQVGGGHHNTQSSTVCWKTSTWCLVQTRCPFSMRTPYCG